jgi:hypothetical protein
MRYMVPYMCILHYYFATDINPLKAELNPVCHLLTLLGAHHILHISRMGVNIEIITTSFCRSHWPRRGSTAARLLGLRVRIPRGAWMSVFCEYGCCQVEVSASGWSLIQRSPVDCGVSEFDREASIMRRPLHTRSVAPWRILILSLCKLKRKCEQLVYPVTDGTYSISLLSQMAKFIFHSLYSSHYHRYDSCYGLVTVSFVPI